MNSRVLEIIKHASLEYEPQKALQELLEACIAQTAATNGSIYVLDRAQTAYIPWMQSGSPLQNPPRINLLDHEQTADDSLLRRVINLHKVENAPMLEQEPLSRGEASHGMSRLLVPIVRDHVCLGAIDLNSEHPKHFTTEHEELVRVAAVIALLLCEKEDTLNLLKALPTPMNYHQPFDEFLEDVVLLLVQASGMPCIALHEWKEDALHCLKTYGLAEDDLQTISVLDYPLFREVINKGKTIIVKGLDSQQGQKFIENLKLRHVKSFMVVPLSVGDEIFGTLLFAVLSDHSYTTLVQNGLKTIANAVGVAIANYKNFHKAEGHLFEQAKIGAAITTVDVAQSARHEARNYLQNSQELLALLARSVLGLAGKQTDQINKLINDISQKLGDLDHALQKIKTITKPPDREKTLARIDDLWRDAFGLALGRLDQQNIRWHIEGNATTKVAVDYITHAFLHLIMNSIDSLKDSKKKGRNIQVKIDPQPDKTKEIIMRYMDNGQGIDPSKLRPTDNMVGRVSSDIFLPGVTSKVDGSGYGLYLVRKIFTDHNGSIDLQDHRNGVVFEMKLPKLG
jgi:signal transduction histidine kinase